MFLSGIALQPPEHGRYAPCPLSPLILNHLTELLLRPVHGACEPDNAIFRMRRCSDNALTW